MAGLLDLFQGGPSPYAGLLSPEQQQGIDQSGSNGLAMGLLNAAGPSRVPVNLFGALGQGMAAANQQRAQEEQNALRMATLGPQLAKAKREEQQQAALDKLKAAAMASMAPGAALGGASGGALPYGGPSDGPVPPAVAAGLRQYGPGMQRFDGQEGTPAAGGIPGAPAGAGAAPHGMTPEMAQFLLATNPAAYFQAMQKDESLTKLGPEETLVNPRTREVIARGAGGKPLTHDFVEGGNTVTKQWDPETKGWKELSRGSRWQPDQTLVEIVDPQNPNRTIMVPRPQAVGQEGKGTYGMVMMPNPRDPSGPPILMQGNAKMLGNLSGQLTQGTQTKVQEDLVSMTAQNAQMNDILGRAKPEYQTFATKGAQWWNATKEKLGANLDPTDRQKLDDFATYKASAGQYFADRLKAMSGAAVTEQEMKRQEAYLPNPGAGVFEGDSPTEFGAKAERMQKFMTNATARLYYVTQKGLSIKDVQLDDMPRVIRERGNVLAKDMEARGVQGDALRTAVKQQIGREFGLVSD